MGYQSSKMGVVASLMPLLAACGSSTEPGAEAADPAALSAAVSSSAPTVVTLTFDDGTVGQEEAASVLSSYELKGTFFVNSGRVGYDENYLDRSQLSLMAAQGHEIGGHTVSHADLTTLTADDAMREVCNDRVALTDMGFTVKSFAYPFGATSSVVEQILEDCGYNSGRSIASLKSPPRSCSSCPTAETIPPADPYRIRTNASVKSDTTLSMLKAYVTQAEDDNGGWVPLVFHHICSGCNPYSISLADFTAFADWLSKRPSTTTVKTVDAVIGGALQAVRPGPPLPTDPPNLVQNYSLEAASGAIPSCFQAGSAGTNAGTWSRTNDAHSGPWAARVDVSDYTSGDRKLVQTQDQSSCAPPAAPGHTYAASVWFKGSFTGSAYAAMVTFYRDAGGLWRYWQTGPRLTASSSWRQAGLTTEAVPSGATAISFGLALAGSGTLITDDYSLLDAE